MEVNEKLRIYLKEHGIKQTFLAQILGIKDRTVSDIVNGKRNISADELGKIAKALNVDANIFLN